MRTAAAAFNNWLHTSQALLRRKRCLPCTPALSCTSVRMRHSLGIAPDASSLVLSLIYLHVFDLSAWQAFGVDRPRFPNCFSPTPPSRRVMRRVLKRLEIKGACGALALWHHVVRRVESSLRRPSSLLLLLMYLIPYAMGSVGPLSATSEGHE